MPQFISDRRLYLNEDKTVVVEEDDPDAAFLLASEGGVVSEDDAKKYGLTAPVKAAAEPEAAAPTPRDDPSVMSEAKAVKQSEVEDKSIAGPKR